MSKTGPEFYDDNSVHGIYMAHRARAENPNNTIEQPLIWQMIGDPRSLDVLDLGCGDARVAAQFQTQGAKSYFGVEGSQKMFAHAASNVEAPFSNVVLSTLEEFEPTSTYDLVVSSLAFHYVADLKPLFERAYKALESGGRFVFSVEHPVITSSNKSLEHSSVREAWLVDDYFDRGARQVRWMGGEVVKFHRTIEDYVDAVTDAGFVLEKLRESDPPRERFEDEELWKRRRRIPLFLLISARKI